VSVAVGADAVTGGSYSCSISAMTRRILWKRVLSIRMRNATAELTRFGGDNEELPFLETTAISLFAGGCASAIDLAIRAAWQLPIYRLHL
jgi:hypothetical protein